MHNKKPNHAFIKKKKQYVARGGGKFRVCVGYVVNICLDLARAEISSPWLGIDYFPLFRNLSWKQNV